MKKDEIEIYFTNSVAHHTLDWYIQTEPGAFNRTMDSRKIAAQILFMVKEYNMDMTLGGVFLKYDNKILAEFGGWKGPGQFGQIKYKIMRPVLSAVVDPVLLLIDPDKTSRKKIEY